MPAGQQNTGVRVYLSMRYYSALYGTSIPLSRSPISTKPTFRYINNMLTGWKCSLECTVRNLPCRSHNLLKNLLKILEWTQEVPTSTCSIIGFERHCLKLKLCSLGESWEYKGAWPKAFWPLRMTGASNNGGLAWGWILAVKAFPCNSYIQQP